MPDLVTPVQRRIPSQDVPDQSGAPRRATARVTSPEEWAAGELMLAWGDVSFDIGLQTNIARVAWTDGPTLTALSCSFRRVSHALRLELHRAASLPAMAWFLHQNRTTGDGLVGSARQRFVEQSINPAEVPADWSHLRRIGEVAASRHPNGRPTWGEVAVVERLLHGAPDDVIDSALLLARESDLGMADVIRAAHRL